LVLRLLFGFCNCSQLLLAIYMESW